MKKKLKLGDGWFYDGEVSSHNQAHGEGTMTNKADKTKHIGKFKNGTRHGLGTTFLSDGMKLTGKWKNNQMPDYGIYEFPDGQLYEGGLKDGKYHGKGKITLPNGNIVEAIFKESEMVKELKKYNPKDDKFNKELLINLKFIIKNFKPKQMSNGEWVFKKPDKKIISKVKTNAKLKELITLFMSEKWKRFPDLIKKFSLKYNYKLK